RRSRLPLSGALFPTSKRSDRPPQRALLGGTDSVSAKAERALLLRPSDLELPSLREVRADRTRSGADNPGDKRTGPDRRELRHEPLRGSSHDGGKGFFGDRPDRSLKSKRSL